MLRSLTEIPGGEYLRIIIRLFWGCFSFTIQFPFFVSKKIAEGHVSSRFRVQQDYFTLQIFLNGVTNLTVVAYFVILTPYYARNYNEY